MATKHVLAYVFILSFILIMFAGLGQAYIQTGHIGLLTVSESSEPDNNTIEQGGVADLYLTIKKGTGRIFIDSFPLSKVDTQITTRFAAELACDFLSKDCSNLDFFYTIRANSALVGGPSAGAASTVLTVAMLDDQHLDNETVMTGTINSGNLIGPVAGISAKTLAAQQFGFKKALIPKWDLANDTPNKNLSIKIIPVSTLEEALYEFTGKNYSKNYPDLKLSSSYSQIMKNITDELCSKYGTLRSDGSVEFPNLTSILIQYGYYDAGNQNANNQSDTNIVPININNDQNVNDTATNTIILNTTDNNSGIRDYFGLAEDAINKGQYYSAASFCFGGNVMITTAMINSTSSKDKKVLYAKLLGEIYTLEQDLSSRQISTIPALETYMVVSERVFDSKSVLEKINPEDISSSDLAYAMERFDTAKAWSQFFQLSGTKYAMDNESLKTVCLNKISEAEERINYLQLYLPRAVNRDDLSQAYSYYDEGQYALCIFTASKAKADADVVLGALYVNDVNLQSYLDEKLAAAKIAISKQESHGIFPILGYSYYEYSDALSRSDNYSSLIYSEYALELSNLDMYFPAEKKFSITDYLNTDYVSPFLFGLVAGILLAVILAFFLTRKSRKQNKNSIKESNAREKNTKDKKNNKDNKNNSRLVLQKKRR